MWREVTIDERMCPLSKRHLVRNLNSQLLANCVWLEEIKQLGVAGPCTEGIHVSYWRTDCRKSDGMRGEGGSERRIQQKPVENQYWLNCDKLYMRIGFNERENSRLTGMGYRCGRQ